MFEGRIGEQHQAYRKGFVLGLTMAEVSLLVVFVLLLLLSLGFARRDSAIRQLRQRTTISPNELRLLEEKAAIVEQLQDDLGDAGKPIDDDFRHLVKNAASALRALQGSSSLKALDEERAKLEQERKLLAMAASLLKSSDARALANTVADQAEQASNLKGQVKNLQDRLADAGKGRVLPSCWTTPAGQIDYLLDVDLTSGGIRAKEHANGARQKERERLPLAMMTPTNVMSPGAFLANTRALYELSEERNCRFYVIVYDSTEPYEKARYKELLQAVEGHFYKLETRNAVTF